MYSGQPLFKRHQEEVKSTSVIQMSVLTGLWKQISRTNLLSHEAKRSISTLPWMGCHSVAGFSPALNFYPHVELVRH